MKKLFLIILSIFMFLPVFANEETVLPVQSGIIENVYYTDSNSAVSPAMQVAEVKLTSGDYKGQTVTLNNMLTGNPAYDIKLKKSMKVLLHAEQTDNGIEFSIEDIARSNTLVWLSIIFCALLIYIGKKKGIYSFVSIIITVLLITHCLSPMILSGISPVFAVVLVCILSTAITMYLVGGFNAKSTSASLGAILSLIFAAVLSYISILTADLTGFSGEYTMFLYSSHPELDFIGITVSAMILATLGAVMDVSMSIASTINEIHITDKTKTVKELFKSGMNVGRDIIGTMANTLILVYLGGSLPLLLLAGNIDLQKFVNLNQVVTEVASALIGSIAIVVCVPFTALVASYLIYKYANQISFETLENDCKERF